MRHRLLMLALFAGIPAAAATCESLATLGRPNTTITTAESVTSGSFKPPTGPAMEKLPAFCRVAGVIKPASDSEISVRSVASELGLEREVLWRRKWWVRRVGHVSWAGVGIEARLCDGVDGYRTRSRA